MQIYSFRLQFFLSQFIAAKILLFQLEKFYYNFIQKITKMKLLILLMRLTLKLEF